MVETTSQSASQNFNWRALLRLAAIADLIVLLVTAIVLDDLLAALLAAVVLLGLALLRFRRGWFGVALLVLVFTDIVIWTLSGAVSNILRGERFIAIIIPSALATISLAGVIAAGAVVIRRRDPAAGEKWAPIIGFGAAILFVLFVVASFFVRREGQQVIQPTDISLAAENMAFSNTELVANPGEITVHLDNHDLWWHTFTIDELGIDLQVPMGANQQISFDAPPGTYRYYCDIPGHEALGMHGRLIIIEAGQGQ
jgi:plastocyanin